MASCGADSDLKTNKLNGKESLAENFRQGHRLPARFQIIAARAALSLPAKWGGWLRASASSRAGSSAAWAAVPAWLSSPPRLAALGDPPPAGEGWHHRRSLGT